jgi:hypothetical protein
MAHEVESCATHAAFVQKPEIVVAEATVDNGNTPVARRGGGNRIEHSRVISTVTTGLHDNGTIDPEMCVKCG